MLNRSNSFHISVYKTAIVLAELQPEESARLFDRFSPQQVQVLATAFSQMPDTSETERRQILAEFFCSTTNRSLNGRTGRSLEFQDVEGQLRRLVDLGWLPSSTPQAGGFNGSCGAYITAVKRP